ncbi:hypothetical protein GCM10022197_20730 [Microlunatus spumicola]|uniref:Uncharacterized protein n=1 Tax=Microlunatus spumicola TaxID=81499 RepID=A0ABP6XEK4_9ACTN
MAPLGVRHASYACPVAPLDPVWADGNRFYLDVVFPDAGLVVEIASKRR